MFNIDTLLKRVEVIAEDRGYWFIRTDSGYNFDTFLNHNIIGIGWNSITLTDLRQKTSEQVKSAIAKDEGIEINQPQGRSKVTAIYNKLLRFINLRQGDLIIIPSSGSAELAFGVIDDEQAYADKKPIEDCDYHKRRRIKWLSVHPLHTLDNAFYKIVKSRHSISDVKPYENYIDNATKTLYKKGEYIHLVLDVQSPNAIEVESLLGLFSSIKNLSKEIISEYALKDEAGEQLLIRLNLQSPGLIELKRKAGVSLVILVALLSSCQDGRNVQQSPNERETSIIQYEKISRIDRQLDSLEIDKEKILNHY